MHVSPSFTVSMYKSINFCLFVFKQVNIQCFNAYMADSLVRECACICEHSHLSQCVIRAASWQIVWTHLRVFKCLLIHICTCVSIQASIFLGGTYCKACLQKGQLGGSLEDHWRKGSNISSKSLESLFSRGGRSHRSLLCQETQKQIKTDGGGERDRERGRMERSREGGQAGNTSMPWASGTNYNRKVMPVMLQDTDTHSGRRLIGHTGAVMNDRLPQNFLSH